MAKRSGSRSSRSGRRAERERATRAREHGLPERPVMARTRDASPAAPSSEATGGADAPPGLAAKESRIPTVVKVVGGALLILLAVYLLGRQRERALTETDPSSPAPSVAAPGAQPASMAEPATSAAGPPASPPASAETR